MSNKLSILMLALFAVMLTACTAEQNYRGVPSPHWQELTGEQKQLIVDQAYEQEFKSTDKKSVTSK